MPDIPRSSWDVVKDSVYDLVELPLLSMGLPVHHPPSGRSRLKGGIVMRPGFKGPTVNIRPPKWKDNTFWIRAGNYRDAQYIADAVNYHIGRGPFHFCDANIQYPPLRLSTGELCTREACSAYVESIAKDPALRGKRHDYRERVKELVLKAVKSPEAVLFLSSLREVARSESNFESAKASMTADVLFQDERHFVGLPSEELLQLNKLKLLDLRGCLREVARSESNFESAKSSMTADVLFQDERHFVGLPSEELLQLNKLKLLDLRGCLHEVARSESNFESAKSSMTADVLFQDERHFVGLPSEELLQLNKLKLLDRRGCSSLKRLLDNDVGDEFTEQGTTTEVDNEEYRCDDSHIQGRSRLCKPIQDKIGRQRQDKTHGVHVSGLYGVGSGNGKTTLCKALCNQFYMEFRGKVCHDSMPRQYAELLRELAKKLSNISHDSLDKFNKAEFENGLNQGIIKDAVFKALEPKCSSLWAKLLGGPQIPESCLLNDVEPASKRFRTRNWSADEIRAVLELMEERVRVDMGSDWNYVSENLWEKYGYDRSSSSCEHLWGTLLQSYRAMIDHGSCIRSAFVAESECSIGVLDTRFCRAPEILKAAQKHTLDTMDERSKDKLLWKLDLEFRDRIERILPAKPFKDTKSIEMDTDRRFQSDLSHLGSADCDEVLYHELRDSEIEESHPQSEDEGLSGDSTATVESQAEDRSDSHVPRTELSHERSYETHSNFAGRNRSTATVLEDDLISRIAPFVNKQIEEALKPLLSVLRSPAEEEQKHREKMLVIEEEKLALKREKMLFTHRVLSNSNAFRASRQHIQHESKLGKGFIK